MKTVIKVENIKCCGCSNSIDIGLSKIEGVGSVAIDVEKGEITIEHNELVKKEVITEKLLSMGYPEVGTAKGFTKIKTNAKSFVSCAIGRINN
jgi:copper chaperone